MNYEILDKEGTVVGKVRMMENHQHDPLQAYAQTTTHSFDEVKAMGYTYREYDPLAGMTPAQRRLIAEGEMSERLYLKMEETLQPPEPDEGMLERLNLCMGFPTTGSHAKGLDYRPYCGNCSKSPRMMRHKNGFMCWHCQHIWDLRLTCRHKHPDGIRSSACLGPTLDRMPIGYRCPQCAGMHHLTGREKTEESIALCDLDCCCEPGFKENVQRECDRNVTPHRWDIRCRKGLWSASSTDRVAAMRTAKAHYKKHHADGDYDE